MGYTTVSTYSTFNMSPTTINLLRIGGEYIASHIWDTYFDGKL